MTKRDDSEQDRRSIDELLAIPDDQLDGRDRLRKAAYLTELDTGTREKSEEKAKRNIFLRVAILIGGPLIVLIGIILLVLPGPGLIIVAFGLALTALEVPFAARLLERVKKRLPQDDDGKLPKSAIVMMVVMCVLATGLSIAYTVTR